MVKKIFKFIKATKYFLMIGIVTLLIATAFIGLKEVSKAEAVESISDVNGDGIINLVDARILAPPATISCPVCVDVNGDKQVNQTDIDLVKHFAGLGDQSQGSKNIYHPRFDINNDVTLTVDDVNIVQNYIGQTVTGPTFGLDDPSELTFGFAAGEVIVKFKPEVSGSQKTSVLSQINSTTKHSFSRIKADVIRIPQSNPENLQKQLASDPTVERAYKNHVAEVATNDPLWSQQWGNRKINIEETWFTETVGSVGNPVKVAIIDTGVDVNHEDLQKNMSATRRNFVAGGDQLDVTDEGVHGTFMAGIIGATVDNNKGIAGVIPNVEIIPLKVGAALVSPSNTFFPLIFEDAVGAAFEWAMAEPGLKVINMSFCMGYTDNNNYLTADMLRDAREEFYITLIAAAGNDGRDDLCYPASHPNVVSVGATTSTDAMCSLSSGRAGVDILAPGFAQSTVPPDLPYTEDDGYESGGCGTSLSAAYISGVAALCRTVRPLPESNEITREDLKCRRFDHQGFGRVDAWATIWYRNCFKFDFNANGYIDSTDLQNIGYRFNQPSLYSVRYDIAHVGGNGAIDMADVWKILSVNGLSCPPV